MNADHRGSGLYNLVRRVGAPFRYRVFGLENVQDAGPAIFVPNHLGSLGPIMCILSIPLRFYPWVIGEMADRQRAPLYLYNDFVQPAWHLNGGLGMAVSRAVARIAVGLINGLGSVVIDSNRGPAVDGYRRSLALLQAGKNLLVFPEDASSPEDAETRLRWFKCGFLGLCSRYERATGRPLPLYPVAVHPGSKTVAIDEALFFEDRNDRHEDVRRTCRRLHERVSCLYRLLDSGSPGAKGI